MRKRYRTAVGAAAVAALCWTTGLLPVVASYGAAPQRAARTAITPNGAWTVYHHDNAHTGYDSTQPSTTTATTGWTSPTLDENLYGEPLVYQGVVYVATLNNTVYALNQTDGTVIWHTNLRAPETTGWTCGNVSPQGILGTPVIDVTGNRIHVATFGADDVYRLEGLNLGTGVPELTTVITTPASGFDWHIQQERGALGIGNGFVYVPFGGRAGDCGAYHGYVFAVPLNGAAVTSYYATPGDGAGFWSAGGVVVDDSTGKVFETSGNGTGSGCAANSDGTAVYENDAVVRLSATLAHEDAFYPNDWRANWCSNDQDLGSSTMVIINSTLAFQSGKWGTGFLVNPQALGGMDGQLFPTPKPAPYAEVDVCRGNHSDANFGSYAYAAPYVYVGCDGHGLVALQVNTATPSFSACGATCGGPSWNAGTFSAGPPIVAGGVAWTVDTGGGGLYGFDAATGAQIYHSAGFGVTHFTTPSEAGGQIFVASDNVVRSFNMVGGCRSVVGHATPPSTASVGAPVTVSATATGCPSPLYQFWILPPGGSAYQVGQAYSASATFNWSTTGLAPGSYRFSIWARDSGSSGAFGNAFGRWDAYDNSVSETLVVPACTGALNASASPPSTAGVGAPVTISAQALGCPDANPLYQFWLLAPGGSAYQVGQAYSTSSTFNWSTTGLAPGTYRFSIWARDASSTGAYGNQFGRWDTYNNSVVFTLTVPACSSLTASVSPPSPAGVGTPVHVTAQALGCPDANPLYQFWVLAPGGSAYQVVQAYSTTATFNWSTGGLAPGTYRFSIWARDASSTGVYGNSFGRWDAYNNDIQFTLTSCSALQVSVSPPSPRAHGTTVTVTAQASGCPNPNPVYQFWVLAPGGTAYQLGQAYSTSNTFTWTTTALAAGSYRFSVWVRDASSAGGSGNASGTWDAYNNDTVYSLT